MDIREDEYGDWRKMAEAEGYVMARRPGAAPVVFSAREWERMPLKGTATQRRLLLEQISIWDAGLSGKAIMCCQRGGYRTLLDIDQAKDHELLRVAALGRGTLKEMRDTISRHLIAAAEGRDVQ